MQHKVTDFPVTVNLCAYCTLLIESLSKIQVNLIL